MNNKPIFDLSVIVPLYNEEESVEPLYASIVNTLNTMGIRFEVIFVDDGSMDQTFERAEHLSRTDPYLKVVKFRQNYGQTPAMAAGIDLASGRILVTMDGDLQNDPADIPKLIEKIDEGYDLAVGWRFDRQDKLISRKIPSILANWLIGKVTGIPIKDNGCSLKAYRAEFIKKIPLYSEMHRFIPAISSIAGSRIAEIKVRHHARSFGESKYGISRVYKVLLDLLAIKTVADFAMRPLRWFAILAIPAFVLATLLIAGSIFVVASTDQSPLSMAGAALFFVSLALYLVFSGALAELISRTGDLHTSKLPLQTATEIRPHGERKPVMIVRGRD